jgi:copper(I)-binding protein
MTARIRGTAAACVLLAAGAGLTACGRAAGSTGGIRVISAAIPEPHVPGRTSAYMDIQNLGPADKLIGVRTSDGGTVTFRSPDAGQPMLMHTVPAIVIPAGGTLRLVPNGDHLSIAGAGPMHGGTRISLTLTFAKAGTITVPAEITNPQSGGSSYFLN